MLEDISADHTQSSISGFINRADIMPTFPAEVYKLIGTPNYFIFAALEAAKDVPAIKDYYDSLKHVIGIKEWDGKSEVRYNENDCITDLTPNKNLKPNDCRAIT